MLTLLLSIAGMAGLLAWNKKEHEDSLASMERDRVQDEHEAEIARLKAEMREMRDEEDVIKKTWSTDVIGRRGLKAVMSTPKYPSDTDR